MVYHFLSCYEQDVLFYKMFTLWQFATRTICGNKPLSRQYQCTYRSKAGTKRKYIQAHRHAARTMGLAQDGALVGGWGRGGEAKSGETELTATFRQSTLKNPFNIRV